LPPNQDGLEVDLDNRLMGARCLFLRAGEQDIAARFQSHAAQILTEIKTLLNSTAEDRAATHLLQVVVSNRDEAWSLTGLAGLLQTARLEHPTLVGQLIAVDPETDAVALAEILERECRAPSESRVRYDAGQRQVASWREMATTVGTEAPVPPWREGATYLITGGAGGLGRLIARDIVARTAKVNLILTGRSALDEDASLARLRDAAQAGACIVYRRVDVTDREAVTQLIRGIEREFGGLRGIIHAAGIVRDHFIRHKSVQELRDVLAPKVSGLVHLDRATQHLDLDFLVCFSSMTGVLGNPGQADYAAANAFMDAYAAYRNGLVAAGQRRGRTLSIDWPLWREGGMAPMGGDKGWETLVRQKTGMIPMHTATGLRALYQALAAGEGQVLVAEGDVSVIREWLFPTIALAHARPAPMAVPDMDTDRLREHTVGQLKRLLADYLKLDAAHIDAEEPLEHYGIDSIMIKQLNARLAAVFGKLSATLFYEYQTLMALADYLVTDHAATCARWSGQASAKPSAPMPVQTAPVPEGPAVGWREPARATSDSIRMTPRRRAAPPASPSPSSA
jgi:aryl carrier-like protein